jgi:4-amino-4-deoxy-L-arabinose transferase-like glycosyltransferase
MKYKVGHLVNKIMSTVVAKFILKYGDIIGLCLFSLFLFTYKLGSVALYGDEAIYSQVARENISHNSFFDFYWNNKLWYEKPPLLIWFTMLSFKIFGISGSSARIFPILFSALEIAMVYLLSREMFKDRLVGCLSSLMLLFFNSYIWFARKNMMDIPLMFFVTLAMFAFWKIYKGESRWYLVAGMSLGGAVMMKNIIGIIPLIAFIIFLLFERRWRILKSKELFLSWIIMLVIVVPWHLLMSVKHGMGFWNSYFSYHVWYRFISGLHTTLADKVDHLFYIKIFGMDISVIKIMFVFSLFYALNNLFKKHKNQLLFLAIWFILFLLIFSFAKTKLQHYMFPAAVPLACLIGWVLTDLYRKKSEFLLIFSGLSLFNLFDQYSVRQNESGETVVIIPYLLKLLFINTYFILVSLIMAWFIYFIIFYKKSKATSAITSLILIIAFNISIPLRPNNHEWIKTTSQKILEKTGNNPIVINVENGYKLPSYSLKFYLPITSKFWYVDKGEKMKYVECKKNCSNFCFIESSEYFQNISRGIFDTKAGDLFACVIE